MTLNNYFLSVFTEEDMTLLREPDQLFVGECEKPCGISLTKEAAIKEIRKCKTTTSPDSDCTFQLFQCSKGNLRQYFRNFSWNL